MSKQIEALKLALECVEAWDRGCDRDAYWRDIEDAVTAIREAMAEQPAQQEQTDSSRDAQEAPFEAWWEKRGQLLRAGGGQYEKTFAWHAWLASLACTEQPAQPQEGDK